MAGVGSKILDSIVERQLNKPIKEHRDITEATGIADLSKVKRALELPAVLGKLHTEGDNYIPEKVSEALLEIAQSNNIAMVDLATDITTSARNGVIADLGGTLDLVDATKVTPTTERLIVRDYDEELGQPADLYPQRDDQRDSFPISKLGKPESRVIVIDNRITARNHTMEEIRLLDAARIKANEVSKFGESADHPTRAKVTRQKWAWRDENGNKCGLSSDDGGFVIEKVNGRNPNNKGVQRGTKVDSGNVALSQRRTMSHRILYHQSSPDVQHPINEKVKDAFIASKGDVKKMDKLLS